MPTTREPQLEKKSFLCIQLYWLHVLYNIFSPVELNKRKYGQVYLHF